MKRILFDLHSVRNSCNNGDPLYHASSGRERKKVYDALRRAGLSYDENVRVLLEKAASSEFVTILWRTPLRKRPSIIPSVYTQERPSDGTFYLTNFQ